jgi:hypothetical protein
MKVKPWDELKFPAKLSRYTWYFPKVSGSQSFILEPVDRQKAIDSIHLCLNPIPQSDTLALNALKDMDAPLRISVAQVEIVRLHTVNLQANAKPSGSNFAFDIKTNNVYNGRIDLFFDFPIMIAPNDFIEFTLPGVLGSDSVSFKIHIMGYAIDAEG